MLPLEGVVAVLVALTLAVSLVVLRRLDGTTRRWRAVLEERFVLGIPWGTLVVVAAVLAVYLFVQDGVSDFENPVVFPYRAWSYQYPLGMVTAPFSHASSGHLTGNLAGTLVAAPIAEYAWGHYTDREDGRLAPVTTNPWLRGLIVFPLAVVGVGLVTSLFAFGPVIGFSGVVFAFAGFAIVRYPIATLIATVGGQGVVLTVYRAIQSPILEVSPQASPPSVPSWATVAIQGHALGFFLGFLLAVALFYRREYRPDPLYLWTALVIYGFSKGLWMIYWFGPDSYVLFRAPGILVVLALALVVTLAVTASERPVIPERVRERVPGSPGDAERSLERALEIAAAGGGTASRRVRELATGPRNERLVDLGRKQTALVAVLLVLALMAGPAIPANAVTVDDTTAGDGNSSLTVADYTVTYAEGVENEMVSVFDLPAFGGDTVEASGLIVSSTDRHIWFEYASTSRLEFAGEASVELGGPGWRETVTAEREGWSAVGNDTAYMIWLSADDEDRQLAHTSKAVTADVRIDGQYVTVVPDDGGFSLEVESDDVTTTVDLPAENERVEAGELTLERTDNAVYASSDGTYVQVASKESYD
ncbi:rhomboid family intramembrane serine protease [Natrialbaceae archaeon A-gly3]